jgi:hypothetical protein
VGSSFDVSFNLSEISCKLALSFFEVLFSSASLSVLLDSFCFSSIFWFRNSI